MPPHSSLSQRLCDKAEIMVDPEFTCGLRLLVSMTTQSIPVSFAGLSDMGAVPSWATGFNTREATLDQLSQEDPLAGIVVVRAPGLQAIEMEGARLSVLAAHLRTTTRPVRVVLGLHDRKSNADGMVRVLRLFPGAASRVGFACGEDYLEESVQESLAKYWIEDMERNPDPLAEARGVIEAVRPLLSESGRLSVKAVAAAFGIPWSRLAAQLGSSKQAVNKTPDAPALQAALRPYERVARLKAVLKGNDFPAWLNRPNPHLDRHTPLELVESGRVEIVADFVESMLTGTPT